MLLDVPRVVAPEDSFSPLLGGSTMKRSIIQDFFWFRLGHVEHPLQQRVQISQLSWSHQCCALR